MVFAYGRMGYTLYSSKFASKEKEKAQMNLFQTCVLMMIMFTLSALNLCISILLFITGYYENLGSTYYTVSMILLVFNQCINPFIYSLRYVEFQDQLKRLVCPGGTSTSHAGDSIATVATSVY